MGYFAKGRQSFADGNILWTTSRLLAYLLDGDALGPASTAWKINGAAIQSGNLTLRIATTVAHGILVNEEVELWGIGGITNAPVGVYVVSNVSDTTHFDVVVTSTLSGTYTSGGYVINLTASTFLSSITGSGSATISKVAIVTAGRSSTNGYLKAPNVIFTSVPTISGGTGQVEIMAIVKVDGASSATDASLDATLTAQRLILCQTPATVGLTGLPQTPTGGNINLDFNTSGIGRI